MHQRRTVGLDIPCPVARLQSRTPLLQAPGCIAGRPARDKAWWNWFPLVESS